MSEQASTAEQPRPQQHAAGPILKKIRRMTHPGGPEAEAAGWAPAEFLDTPRTEGAFYLRFQRLPTDRRRALRPYWHKAAACAASTVSRHNIV